MPRQQRKQRHTHARKAAKARKAEGLAKQGSRSRGARPVKAAPKLDAIGHRPGRSKQVSRKPAYGEVDRVLPMRAAESGAQAREAEPIGDLIGGTNQALPSAVRFVQNVMYVGSAPDTWERRYVIRTAERNGLGSAILFRRGLSWIIISPWTLRAWSVPEWCAEITTAQDYPITRDRLVALIEASWENALATKSEAADLEMAASVLMELGSVPPASVRHGATAGKPLEAHRLTAVTGAKRLRIVDLLFPPRWVSIHELMARTNGTRSYVLSHLNSLHRATGLGYETNGGAVRLLAPDGWTPRAYSNDPDVLDMLGLPRAATRSIAEMLGNEDPEIAAMLGDDLECLL